MIKTLFKPIDFLRAHLAWNKLRKGGWRVIGLIFMYYLIRDTLLYLVLPLLITGFAFKAL